MQHRKDCVGPGRRVKSLCSCWSPARRSSEGVSRDITSLNAQSCAALLGLQPLLMFGCFVFLAKQEVALGEDEMRRSCLLG